MSRVHEGINYFLLNLLCVVLVQIKFLNIPNEKSLFGSKRSMAAEYTILNLLLPVYLCKWIMVILFLTSGFNNYPAFVAPTFGLTYSHRYILQSDRVKSS